MSPVGYMCEATRRAASGGLVGYMAPPGGLEEDDLDHGGGSQNLLCECRFTSDFPEYKYSVAVLKYIFRYQYLDT